MLARADAGEQQVAPEILALDVLVKEVFRRIQPFAAADGIDFSIEFAEPVFILADQTAIEQIVSNLLQNAVRYTLRGGRVTVKIRFDNNETAIVEVEDTGIGIDEADLPRVFERFYRARNARLRQSEGSGLGLSISRLLAESLGGAIMVESETGKGSKFVFSMPAIRYSNE